MGLLGLTQGEGKDPSRRPPHQSSQTHLCPHGTWCPVDSGLPGRREISLVAPWALCVSPHLHHLPPRGCSRACSEGIMEIARIVPGSGPPPMVPQHPHSNLDAVNETFSTQHPYCASQYNMNEHTAEQRFELCSR